MLRLLVLFAALAIPAHAQDGPGPFASFDLASEAILDDPHDLAFGPDGLLYVADKFGARIAVFDPETLDLIKMVGVGLFPGVHDISFGQNGQIAVAVTGTSRVVVYGGLEDLPDRPSFAINAARTEGALVHSSGAVFAMASGLGALGKFQGGEMTAIAQGHFGAHDVAEAADGSVWVADNRARQLVRYDEDLKHLQTLDHAKFGFVGPRYLDVTDFGHLVVADQDAHRILLIDPNGPEGGTLLGVLGTGSPGMGPGLFDDPEGVAVRGTRYFFADSDNNRIVRYSVVLN